MNLRELFDSPLGRAHRRLHNVWLHDLAERLRLRRRAIARSDGLDPNDVEPFPTGGDVTIVQTGVGLLRATAAAGLMLLLGAGGAAGAAWLAARLTAPAPPAALPAHRPAARGTPAGESGPPHAQGAVSPAAAQEFRITFWTEEGQPIAVAPLPEEEKNHDGAP